MFEETFLLFLRRFCISLKLYYEVSENNYIHVIDNYVNGIDCKRDKSSN